MRPSSQSPRTPSELSDSVHHRLNLYALAVSAAGVGALALAHPAQARIIYTPADMPIANHSMVVFQFGGTTKAQFSFVIQTYESPGGSAGSFQLSVFPAGRNRIWGTAEYASALGSGVRVGQNDKKFQAGHDLMERVRWHCCRPLSSTTWGQWGKVSQGYLGLKLFLRGKPHYGWARISMRDRSTLTGYAYETIPNKPIITGKTKGPDVITAQPNGAPGSLGHLALGRK